ncbi:hypothetical protein Hanom_Chr06g00515501 [Helianthus anomalus]
MVYSCGLINDNRIMIRGCVYHQKERHNMVNSPRRSMIQSEKRKSCTWVTQRREETKAVASVDRPVGVRWLPKSSE